MRRLYAFFPLLREGLRETRGVILHAMSPFFLSPPGDYGTDTSTEHCAFRSCLVLGHYVYGWRNVGVGKATPANATILFIALAHPDIPGRFPRLGWKGGEARSV